MSLTTALNNAQAIFNNTGTQSSVVSNNIANANNTNYSRRQAMLTTDMAGAQVVQISRSSEPALQKAYLSSASSDSAQQLLLNAYSNLQSATIGGNDNEVAPATYLSAFQDAMQNYAGSPSNATAAQSAINAAQSLTTSLNNATTAVQGARADADKQIKSDVDTLNSLLKQFQTANEAVKSATTTAGPTSSALADAMDQRDSILNQISKIVGVTTVTRGNNDMALYTSSGTTLFETIPRTVTFKSTDTYTAATPVPGNSVYIDGVALTPGQSANTTAQGTLQAALQIRDDVAPTYQKQLDEIARGLVTVFAETNSNPSKPTLPGLFTWSGGTVPASGTAVTGLAGSITVNSKLITSQGGDPTLLRDGGINNTATETGYTKNTSGGSGYSTQLDAFITAMNAKMAFDPTAGSSTNASLMDYSASSIGWLEGQRSTATTAAENTSAALSRSSGAYSNATGVSLDEELTLMMDIEQSYKAGTKILNTVNQMLQAVLDLAS
ncbi:MULTISPECIES: flagellar hook-associated protein FlgK [Rhizobium]|uniref:Flagellar hook-associated protein 1 n=1 Tax=Rhizobium tropici TaxID=398 RepID=A0A6P1BZH4_RHITR|nr:MULTISPECIES: flagellar hook-associated protein FlgK [Rhizobium]AGB70093.1 flagellar hook-associated protein FlgK [Rhizobium tropici CIAT 899]MBB4239513.1 flagellar hook-associated protein 1 FlgK [Rhizobium tropici]MBB5590783.1 flagellar hook-associated protein 1 FlgK [Rhizobium tropici]MBB6490008.1 flagellar hook-associated protein 1 FlgK [Rhizobium tropici]NEV09501.1 flagellar hook-associated protein FlgK [Rhizobium tropici]